MPPRIDSQSYLEKTNNEETTELSGQNVEETWTEYWEIQALIDLLSVEYFSRPELSYNEQASLRA